MNLMVILVPFLLITAVFSRLAILELNLPGSSSESADKEEQVFQLEIIVRGDRIEVGDRTIGVLGTYPMGDNGYDFAAMSEKLGELKNAYPEKTDASILLEADIPYDTLVQVMDRVRMGENIVDDSIVRTDLFPEISIGDAPISAEGA
ncbi:MAG: biopolymer transporter ExbD [Woeseia sp.]|nr:biopolymer transporter ExbD [Woeseia sp.]